MERVKPGVVAVEGKRGEPAPPTSTLSSSSISMSFYSSSLFEERALLGYKISPPDLFILLRISATRIHTFHAHAWLGEEAEHRDPCTVLHCVAPDAPS